MKEMFLVLDNDIFFADHIARCLADEVVDGIKSEEYDAVRRYLDEIIKNTARADALIFAKNLFKAHCPGHVPTKVEEIGKTIPTDVDICYYGCPDLVGYCPSCHAEVGNYFDYCPFCGQALDWKEDQEEES